MARLVVTFALACALGGVAAPRAEAEPPPAPAFCWDFDALGGDVGDLFEGTSADDHVTTFGGDDRVFGFGGADCASGGAGNDELHLGPGDDQGLGRGGHDLLTGGAGRDALSGGLGADRLEGGPDDDLLVDDADDRARDVLRGGDGSDELRAGLGWDVLEGGDGDDVLHAANDAIDTVDCGDGVDRAFADRGDVLVGCERPVFGYRPAVRRAPVSGTRRTTFRLRWDATGATAIEPAIYAPRRAGCRQGSWRVRTRAGAATLRWVGRFPPCPGRYTWRVVAVDADGTQVACESGGKLTCLRRDVVGEASFTVR